MREIKFRAWDERNEEMIYKPTLFDSHNFKEKLGCALELNWHIQNTIGFFGALMQYTGLKDKNGKEIYEGDILTSSLSFIMAECNSL